jgi:hypothetical protein
MSRHVYGVVCPFVVLAWAGGAAASVSHMNPVVPPGYFSMTPPAAGTTFVDPALGTTVKRLSNALGTGDAANGGPLTWVLHEYSTPSAFNSDNSRLLLLHDSYFAVYDGNGGYIKDAPFDMNASTEPRWSRSDPSLVYYMRGNQLKSYSAATGAVNVVHTFAEYGRISGNGESDICFDGDHMVVVGDGRFVFVYTLSSGTKGPVFDSGGRGFDSVYIAADDTVTITWLQGGTGRYNGIELFDRNMTFLRQVARAGGHMDMGRDVNGDPVLVWANAADPTPICNNGVVKIRLRDGQQTCLVSLDWNLAFHVSSSEAGWAVVSTYAPSDPNPASFWPAFTNEIFRIRLDGSGLERLAHHRSRPFNGYNYMSKASVSRDGSRIVYASNFSLQSLLGYPSEYSDAYMMTLGGGSPSPTPGPTPGPTVPPTATPTAAPTTAPTAPPASGRVEQDNAAVRVGGSWYPNVGSAQSGGSAILSMEAGTDVTLSFSGTGVTWVGLRDAWAGLADVYLDGALRGRVDTYSAGSNSQQPLWSTSGLASGVHTLRVSVVGAHSSGSAGSWVWVDAFDVVTSGGATRTVSIAPASTVEGQTGSTLLAFGVTLSAPSAEPVTATYTTQDGTALAGADYAARTGTVTFAPGQTSRPVLVRVWSDTTAEANETLTVRLTGAVNATIGTASALGTLTNDDPYGAAAAIRQYRLFSRTTSEHLYTSDLNEYNVLGPQGWNQEGPAYTTLASGGAYGATFGVPMYRLYHLASRQHHWTSDANEAMVLAEKTDWLYEGIATYVLAAATAGSVALHRVALPGTPLHLWTADANEKTVLSQRGWLYEGIVGYVLP